MRYCRAGKEEKSWAVIGMVASGVALIIHTRDGRLSSLATLTGRRRSMTFGRILYLRHVPPRRRQLEPHAMTLTEWLATRSASGGASCACSDEPAIEMSTPAYSMSDASASSRISVLISHARQQNNMRDAASGFRQRGEDAIVSIFPQPARRARMQIGVSR